MKAGGGGLGWAREEESCLGGFVSGTNPLSAANGHHGDLWELRGGLASTYPPPLSSSSAIKPQPKS